MATRPKSRTGNTPANTPDTSPAARAARAKAERLRVGFREWLAETENAIQLVAHELESGKLNQLFDHETTLDLLTSLRGAADSLLSAAQTTYDEVIPGFLAAADDE
jgi:hypothetical protein